MKVRFANVDDAKDISNVCSEGWRVTYKNLYSEDFIEKVIKDFYNVDRIQEECQQSTREWHGYIIAERDNQVLGCIGGACEEDVGFIYVLYVRPDCKGQGIGSALLEYLTDYQKDIYDISLQEVYATTGNMMGIPFYEKNGFQLVSIVPNWLNEDEGTQSYYRRPVK